MPRLQVKPDSNFSVALSNLIKEQGGKKRKKKHTPGLTIHSLYVYTCFFFPQKEPLCLDMDGAASFPTLHKEAFFEQADQMAAQKQQLLPQGRAE